MTQAESFPTKAVLVAHLNDTHGRECVTSYPRWSLEGFHHQAHQFEAMQTALATPRLIVCQTCGIEFIGRGRACRCSRACTVRAYRKRLKERTS